MLVVTLCTAVTRCWWKARLLGRQQPMVVSTDSMLLTTLWESERESALKVIKQISASHNQYWHVCFSNCPSYVISGRTEKSNSADNQCHWNFYTVLPGPSVCHSQMLSRGPQHCKHTITRLRLCVLSTRLNSTHNCLNVAQLSPLHRSHPLTVFRKKLIRDN